MKYPYLELRWLPNSFLKQLHIMPEIVYIDQEGVGGYYASPYEEHRLVADTTDVDTSNGMVVINTLAGLGDDEFLIDTTAHEIRHHWQYLGGHTFQTRPDKQNWYHLAETYEYQEAIIKYFTLNWDEMDALLFATRFSKANGSFEWLGWLRKYHESNHRSRRG